MSTSTEYSVGEGLLSGVSLFSPRAWYCWQTVFSFTAMSLRRARSTREKFSEAVRVLDAFPKVRWEESSPPYG